MERTESLFELLCDVDDTLIVNAAPKPLPARVNVWKKWIPAVACLCLAAVIGLAARRLPATIDSTKPAEPKYPVAEDVTADNASQDVNSEAAYPIGFIKTTAYQYDRFTIGNTTYTARNTGKKISEFFLDGKLGETMAGRLNAIDAQKRPITYYRILGVSEECAVAVLFEGENDIYIYASTAYSPVTLGELFEDTALPEYLSVEEITVTRAENEQLRTATYRIGKDFVIQHLLTPMLAATITTVDHNSGQTYPAVKPEMVKISGRMEMFGYSHLDILISRNGYLVISLFGSKYIFPIEDAQLQSFLTALEQSDSNPDTKTEDIPPRYNYDHSYSGYRNGAQSFPEITIADIRYVSGTTDYGIDADRVGEQLGEVKAADTLLAPTVAYYRLKDVSVECGIAVQFPDDPTYYSYHNLSYRPDTLGDLIGDLGLTSYLRVGDPTVNYREAPITLTARFRNTEVSVLWQTLLNDTEAECIGVSNAKKPKGEIRLAIPVRLPLFCGSQEFTLWVTEDGCLHTNLFASRYSDMLFSFRLSEGQTEQYIAALVERYPDFFIIVTTK